MPDRFILTPLFLDEPDDGLESLARDDWRVVNPELAEGDTLHRIATVHQHLADEVAKVAGSGDRPVSIAGDCCTTLGVMAGLQRAGMDPTLIWIDAHGDLNTWETTPSGFLGGMPLAMMMGVGDLTVVEAIALTPVPQDRIILTDGRDLDPGEQDLIDRYQLIQLQTITDLMQHSFPDRPVYVHFDTDVLDPVDAPSMGYPAPGGPTRSEMEQVFRHIARTTNVAAVSMSTWRPKMDTDGRSKEVCMHLLNVLID